MGAELCGDGAAPGKPDHHFRLEGLDRALGDPDGVPPCSTIIPTKFHFQRVFTSNFKNRLNVLRTYLLACFAPIQPRTSPAKVARSSGAAARSERRAFGVPPRREVARPSAPDREADHSGDQYANEDLALNLISVLITRNRLLLRSYKSRPRKKDVSAIIQLQ